MAIAKVGGVLRLFARRARGKRDSQKHDDRRILVNDPQSSPATSGPFGLTGPVDWPEKGTLPLRRDLAHIALAPQFLVAHYAVPSIMRIGGEAAPLVRSTQNEDDVLLTLEPGAQFQALDITSSWVWGCMGPEGPSGYVKRSAFAA